MSDERILKALTTDLDLLLESKISKILEEKGIAELNYQTISPEEAAKRCRCGKAVIFDLINDRENSKFPGAKISAKTFVVDAVGLTKWLKNGGLIQARTETGESKLKLKAVK